MVEQQFNKGDPKFCIKLQKTGRLLLPQSYSYTQDFLSASDAFSFVYYDTNPSNTRGLELQPVEISIDGRLHMLGRIEKTTRGGEYGAGVFCEGRDYMSDLVECNIDPRCIVKDGTTLKDAVLYLLAPCGILEINDQSLRLSSRTGKYFSPIDEKLSAKQVKDLRPEAGKGVYETVETLLARYGLMLQPSIDRNTVIVQGPSYIYGSVGRIYRHAGDPNDNLVISATATRDFSSMPTTCIFTGKQGTAVEKGGAKGLFRQWNMFSEWVPYVAQELADILTGMVFDGRNPIDEPKKVLGSTFYRLLYFLDHHAKTQEQIERSQLRAVSDRLKDTLRYEVTVRGHTNPVTGLCWSNDTILEISDDMCDVHEDLWCYRVTFANSKDSGPTTKLSMIRSKSFMVYADPIENVKVFKDPKQNKVIK